TRWSYRNRMQLHYDKKLGKLGIRTTSGILAIEQCLMPNSSIKTAFVELYQNWRNLVKSEPNQGHIEIYARPEGVQISINKPYSDGGFSQVYADMNARALELIIEFTKNIPLENVIDLFGGAGNLSAHLTKVHVDVIDGVTPDCDLLNHQSFHQLDLYSASALFELKKLIKSCELMIVDPPRSGFSGLKEYIETFKPKYLIYMSCFAPTMLRDLKEIPTIEREFHLLDFFPSTHHYETLAFIKLK